MGTEALPARFLKFVCQRGSHWVWTGATSDGYGRFRVGRRSARAHVVAYRALRGRVPRGKVLDHHRACSRACVHPFHLDPVSQRTNVARGRSPVAKFIREDA